MAQAVLAADLPLTPAPAPGAAAPLAQAPSNAFELGGFTIWGVDGDTVTAADFAYDAAAKTLTVNTDRHFAIQNTDQTKDSDGYLAVNSSAAIVIPAGRDAHITLAGVGILSAAPLDLATGASCSLVLADGTKNSFKTNYPTTASATGNHSAIHCGTGSSISIDDSVSNRTSKGTPVIPEDGVVPRNPDLNPGDPAADEPYLLANGAKVRAGDPLTKLDSENPGALLAQNDANGMAAAIGAPYGEAGGSITIDGGIITAIGGRGDRGGSGYIDYAAGIGSAGPAGGDGTGLGEWITINGGRITAQGAYHGPGIGGGPAGKTGNICINGGYVVSNGGVHGRGFGTGCDGGNSSEFQIVLTGGTLLPTGGREYKPADIGAPGAKVTITGGSIGNNLGVDSFIFDGTATNAEGETQTVRLGDIAALSEADSVPSIRRENGQRTMSVTAGVDDAHNIGLVSRDVQQKLDGYTPPAGCTITLEGENESINSAMLDLVKMLLLAVVFIYLIMVAQFQSLLSPFIVMFTIPLAFTGGLLALLITGKELSIIAMLGFLVLAGVVVNNGIVFVDTINQLRLEGMPRFEAIVRTGRTRIRPVLMTALTTILAMSTMAMAVGQGAEMTQPMAIVTIGGLTYATLLTLVVVPVLYDIFCRKAMKQADVDEAPGTAADGGAPAAQGEG